MIEDIIIALRFMTQLSVCDDVYKERIEQLSKIYYDDKLTEALVGEYTEYFRSQNLKYIKSNTDRENFAAAFMMLLNALSSAVWQRDSYKETIKEIYNGRQG